MMINELYIILIAFALAMDAFAVSLAGAVYLGKTNRRQKFRLSFHFGLFQFLMPLIGWMLGASIEQYVRDYDHWIAFAILMLIGAKMCYDAFSEERTVNKDISKGWSLVALSVATSIDAMAVGFSYGVIDRDILFPAIIIGLVASGMSLFGIKLGEKLSVKFGSNAALIGGIVLMFIAANILREHLQ